MMVFNICTISNDLDQYERMKNSFIEAGFSEEKCQFSLFNNSVDNVHDPFKLINKLKEVIAEPYIILCHQDVLIDRGDKFHKLLQIIEAMNGSHPNWAVLGNAGINSQHQLVAKITDPSTPQKDEKFPQRVYSLDENFLVIKTSANFSCSDNLSGFHFYASDLCFNAMLQGYECFVVDFHITHLSSGNFSSNFYDSKAAFYKRWCSKFTFCYVRTTCTPVMILSKYRLLRYLGSREKIRNFLANRKMFNPLTFSL